MSRTRFIVPAAFLILFIGGAFDVPHLFRAWLIGWLFWLGAALGAMAFLMMHHLSGGRWGWPLRRPAEALAATMPFIALAALPMVLGLRFTFPWADAERVAHDALLAHRERLFNVPFSLGRAAAFLVIWSLLAWALRRESVRHDATGETQHLDRLQTLSAIGLVVYFITMSLASVDWIASREVDWYSSTFGLITILGQATTGLCVLIIAVAFKRDQPAMLPLLSDRATHDLGNLLQVTVILWSYVSFMQYLIQWIGNGQDESMWFHHRTSGGWNWIGRALIGLQFGVPFVLLLFQRAKRDVRVLACIAGGVLVMRFVDLLWMIDPSAAGPDARGIHWLDFIAPIALGGVGWTLFNWNLARMSLAPRAARADRSTLVHNEGTDDAELANL